MRNRVVLVFVLAALGIVALWWFFIYSPAGDELDDVRADRQAAEDETQRLQAQLQQLQDIDSRGPEIDAALMALEGLVPPNPDLAGFILSANEIAVTSGIDWLSISPAEPAASATGTGAVVNMAISIEGGFFQTLEYLNQLENLSRLVIVDAVNIASGAGTAEDGTTTATSTLSTTLAARMFTSATPVPEVVPGTTDTTTPESDATVPEGDATVPEGDANAQGDTETDSAVGDTPVNGEVP